MSMPTNINDAIIEDQLRLHVAMLMAGGEEDEDTCKTLDAVTKLLSDESLSKGTTGEPLHALIDHDGFDTILGYLDMRRGDTIRGHATLTVSAYMKASESAGALLLHQFFSEKIKKGTYDNYIVAFSVASSIFPVLPAISAELFLSEGFVASLGPLMTRKWKSKKVEQACLEMLNAACINSACREAIQKYCTEWLEELIANHSEQNTGQHNEEYTSDDGPLPYRVHSQNVRSLAAVILAKLQVVPRVPAPGSADQRVETAVISMEELSDMFTNMLSTSNDSNQGSSIEGLAFASLQPKVKEKLSANTSFLATLIKTLRNSPPKSPTTYGSLTILANLTNYLPAISEEQKRMQQLKAYANASKENTADELLSNDEHVIKRCKAVFEAGVVPVLVTHSQRGSPASLNLVVSIVFSLAKTPKLRGQMAQQGAIKLLLHAHSVFPEADKSSRLHTAHALALILISTNPLHVFGGSNPQPMISAIRPLISLLADDPTNESPSLLPAFESLLALTNLASTDDSARNPIIRLSWPTLDELLLSNNVMVTRATVELICNLMQSTEGVAKFADGSKQANQRMHIILALADSEDLKTRMAAGGGLASLTEWDTAVNAILERERGVKILLALCGEDEDGLRHRGVVCVLNVISVPGEIGERGLQKVRDEGGLEALKECLKKSRSQEVLEITVEALKKVMETKNA